MKSLQINVTNICASNCIMCKKKTWLQSHMSKNLMSWILTDRLFRRRKVSSVFLSGGDPLLHPNILWFLNELAKKKVSVGIVTAANFEISYEKVFELVENPSLKWVRFSIDAGSKETYKKIRGVDKFDVVIENLNRFYCIAGKLGKRDDFLRVNFTLMKGNEEELEKLKKVVYTHVGNVKIKVWPVSFDESLKVKETKKDVPRYCIVIQKHAIIDVDGHIYPCCYLMHELEDWWEGSKRIDYCYGRIIPGRVNFSDIFYSEKNRKLRRWLFFNRVEECFSEGCTRYRVENEIYQKRLEDGGFFL